MHQGVRFLGCTLWSDYRLYDSAEHREQGLQQAGAMVRDFSRIRVSPDFADLFTPAVAQLLFARSVAWLEQQFAAPHDGPTVVITHFAPARGSIAAKFLGSPLNACFVSDLEAQIQRWQPDLWLHPLGPLSKNLPIAAALWVLWQSTRPNGQPTDTQAAPDQPATRSPV